MSVAATARRVRDNAPQSRACDVCGREFTPARRSNARICSNRCHQQAFRDRLRRQREDYIEPATFLEWADGDPLDAIFMAAVAPSIRRAFEVAA